MHQQSFFAIAVATAVGAVLTFATPQSVLGAEPLECPNPAGLGPPATGKLAADLVPNPRALDDVETLTRTAALFREHDFSDADTVNYLTAFFCPVIRDDRSLSPPNKREKVASFSSVVSDVVYRRSR